MADGGGDDGGSSVGGGGGGGGGEGGGDASAGGESPLSSLFPPLPTTSFPLLAQFLHFFFCFPLHLQQLMSEQQLGAV